MEEHREMAEQWKESCVVGNHGLYQSSLQRRALRLKRRLQLKQTGVMQGPLNKHGHSSKTRQEENEQGRGRNEWQKHGQ